MTCGTWPSGTRRRSRSMDTRFTACSKPRPPGPRRPRRWSSKDWRSRMRELNARADRLAAGLRANGVGPESRVGIAMGRSLDLAVALLGTLKAGAAFVPLDPAYPPARLEAMRTDAGIQLCLDAAMVAALGLGCGCRPHRSGDAPPTSSTPPARPASREAWSSRIVRSSTTCSTPHAASALRPGDRVLQFASLSFDIAIEEMFPAWSAGAVGRLPRRGDPAARRLCRLGRRSRESPSSTCRRPTGTPGSQDWPTRGRGCPKGCGWSWSAARRR